jgi:H+/gluconate symporter-like permease
MYPLILAIHSLVRWLVLASLLYAIYCAYSGWLNKKKFSAFDNSVRHITATIAHVQLLIGLWLYFISPIADYFLHHYAEALHEREIRFFGMEHISMMLLAVIVITITSVLTKRRPTDMQKFRSMAIGYTLALLIIVSSVPWPFSPLVSRPWLRMF